MYGNSNWNEHEHELCVCATSLHWNAALSPHVLLLHIILLPARLHAHRCCRRLRLTALRCVRSLRERVGADAGVGAAAKVFGVCCGTA